MRHQPVLIMLSIILLGVLGATGCMRKPKPESQSAQPAPMFTAMERSHQVKSPDPRIDRSDWPVLVAFGDSLTSGHRVPPEQNYPSQLQALLDEQGYRYRVVNAGIAGDTSAGGLNRVGSILEHEPSVVILELGANDGLQGKSVVELRQNLAEIIEELKAAKVTVVLAGMHAPPNYGPEYTQSFHQVYADLATTYRLPFVPFFLDGVAGVPELNLADGIHPTAEGYALVVKNLWKTLEPVLKR